MDNAATKPKTILILSNNRDFIEPLSSLVTRELEVSCKLLASEAEIEGEINEQEASLLITDMPVSNSYKFPVINVSLPVRVKILLSNINELLENSIESGGVFKIAPDFELFLKQKILIRSKSDAALDLTDKESGILQIIAQAGDLGVSRDILLKEVWGFESDLDTHTLETHIYRLRKKIRDNFDVEMIKAFEGGYKF